MKQIKYIFKLFALVILIVVLWYSIGRIFSKQNAINVYEISNQEIKTDVPADITVMTFNVAHGRGNKLGASNWQKNGLDELKKHLEQIAKQIESSTADIVVLNEVDFSSVWSFHFNQAKYIAKNTSLNYVVEQKNMDVSFPFIKYQFGNAILSRYPLKDAAFIQHLPLSKIENIFVGNHDAVYATSETPLGNIGVFAIHLDYRSEDTRVEAIKQLEEISNKSKQPIVILGDFNSTPTGYPKSSLSTSSQNAISYLLDNTEFKTDSALQNDAAFYTFPKEKPDRVIDWIFGNSELTVDNLHVIDSELSDHLPVVANIKLLKLRN